MTAEAPNSNSGKTRIYRFCKKKRPFVLFGVQTLGGQGIA